MLTATGKKALAVLIDRVKKQETIGYSELAHAVDSKYDAGDPHQWIYSVIGNVSKYTYKELGVMISIIVIRQDGSPGHGFKELAGILIADNKDALSKSDTFINTHLKTLYAIDHKKLDRLLII